MTNKPRIILGEDDFADAQVADPPPPPPAAPLTSAPGSLPPVARRPPLTVSGGIRTSSPSATSGPWWLYDARTAPLIAAGVGVLLAWAINEIFGIADIVATSKIGSDAIMGLYSAIVGVAFGGAVLVFDRAVAGAWGTAGRLLARASGPLAGVGFAAGFLANVLYLQIVQSVITDAEGTLSLSENDVRLYIARALGWAIFGAGIGAAIGFVDKSRRRAINGAIGGALGGAAGGLVFQFAVANLDSSATLARLLGLIGIGALIVVATRAVEAARREAWLRIVAGGMAGKEFILYHDITRIGASPDCEVFLLKDPAVAKLHAQIADRGSDRVISASSDAPVYVNQSPVQTHVLRDGDQVQIGATVIAYSERAISTANA